MMTAREAMQQAIERAQIGDIEGGTLWLGIARELRKGASGAPKPAAPQKVRNCAKCGQLLVVATDPVEGGGVAVHDWSGRQDCGETTFKDERPGDAAENIGRCECGYFLTMGPTGQVVHSRTGLMECPVGRPGPDDTVVHTYANPE